MANIFQQGDQVTTDRVTGILQSSVKLRITTMGGALLLDKVLPCDIFVKSCLRSYFPLITNE